MFYTLAEAAKATGTSRSAILAAIESGRIPAVKDLFGQWQIDHDELHRLYALAVREDPEGDAEQPLSASERATLEAELEALLSAAGNELRQPHVDAGCHENPMDCPDRAAPGSTADSNGADLWSPATSDASEFIRAPAESSELPETSSTPGREAWAAANGRSPAIDQLAIPFPEPVSAWDREIRIGDHDKALRPAAPAGTRARRALLIAGVMIAALGLGWIGGSGAHLCFDRAVSPSPEQKNDSSARNSGPEHRIDAPGTGREPSATTSSIRRIGIPPATKRVESPAPAAPSSSQPPQNAAATARTSAVQQQAKAEAPSPRTPAPETRPMTIDGWTIREVVGGTAVLQGPNGVFRAARGDTVPGVGRVYSIVRWGNRWIVATGTGLISTP